MMLKISLGRWFLFFTEISWKWIGIYILFNHYTFMFYFVYLNYLCWQLFLYLTILPLPSSTYIHYTMTKHKDTRAFVVEWWDARSHIKPPSPSRPDRFEVRNISLSEGRDIQQKRWKPLLFASSFQKHLDIYYLLIVFVNIAVKIFLHGRKSPHIMYF